MASESADECPPPTSRASHHWPSSRTRATVPASSPASRCLTPPARLRSPDSFPTSHRFRESRVRQERQCSGESNALWLSANRKRGGRVWCKQSGTRGCRSACPSADFSLLAPLLRPHQNQYRQRRRLQRLSICPTTQKTRKPLYWEG